MTDRRALALSAACITGGILAFLIVTYPSWKAAVGSIVPWGSEVAAPAAVPDHAKTAAASSPAPTPAAPLAVLSSSHVPTETSRPDAQAADPTPAETDTPKGPSFDVVRVEPSGESVIAARAAPGADIALLDGGTVIARAKADANGQVALLPPTLAPGEHSLMLSVGEPNSPTALSSQSVAVSVSPQRTAPMVALIQPDQPAKLLSAPSAEAGTPAAATGSQPGTVTPLMSIASIETEEMGSFYASGKAAPGSHCRVYLNGSFVATVTTGTDGVWSLKIKHGMKPGHYVVRADQLESAAGQVQARAEVPFDYPARAGKNASLLGPKVDRTASAASTPVAMLKDATTSSTASGGSRQSPSAPTVVSSGTPSAVTSPNLVTRPETQVATASRPSAAVVGSSSAPAATSGPVDASLANASVAPQGAPSSTIIAQLLTTRVIRGDTLWRISRKILGHGERYTQIYAANTTQIRDPRLIYPGQIFVMPQTAP